MAYSDRVQRADIATLCTKLYDGENAERGWRAHPGECWYHLQNMVEHEFFPKILKEVKVKLDQLLQRILESDCAEIERHTDGNYIVTFLDICGQGKHGAVGVTRVLHRVMSNLGVNCFEPEYASIRFWTKDQVRCVRGDSSCLDCVSGFGEDQRKTDALSKAMEIWTSL